MEPTDSPPSPLEEVFEAIAWDVTSGLTPDQADWARDAFRRYVLPYDLRLLPDDPEMVRRVARVVIENLREQFGGLSPEERWAAVQRAWAYSRLLPLADAAFELAKQRH